jgi:hypothetical protein
MEEEMLFSIFDWTIEVRKREGVAIFYIESSFDKNIHNVITSESILKEDIPITLGPNREFFMNILRRHFPECLV